MHPKGHWSDNANRKEFFLSLADKKGFDPNVPQNWENISIADIKESKVLLCSTSLWNQFGFQPHAHLPLKGAGLLSHYQGSLYRALQDTFPELNISGFQFFKFLQMH